MESLLCGSLASVPKSGSMINPQKRYHTVIQNVPQSMNREQILSLLNSVGSVKSLQMINVQSSTGLTRRLGLVEVADNESVFRLTSRQFYVGGSSTLIHKFATCESRIVKYFDKYPELNIQVSFATQNSSFIGKVLKMLQEYGEIKLVSINSLKSDTTLNFKASRSYTIGAKSTTLEMKFEGVPIFIKYLEETVSEELLQLDSDFWIDFQQIFEKPKSLISETARFFNQFVENSTSCGSGHQTPPTEDEDDLLSLLSDDLDDEVEAAETLYQIGHYTNYPLLTFQKESYSLLAGFHQNLEIRLENWANSCQQASRNYEYEAEYISAKSNLFVEEQWSGQAMHIPKVFEEKRSKKILRPEQCTSQSINQQAKTPVIVLRPALATEDDARVVNSGASGHKKSKMPKKNDPDKGGSNSKQKESANLPPKPNQAVSTKIDDLATKESSKAQKAVKKNKSGPAKVDPKNESVVANTEPLRSDGSLLLSQISCIPPDYEEINARVMAQVHEKWRRFAEIKDQMRMEKYQEYLQQKKQECANPSNGSIPVDNQ